MVLAAHWAGLGIFFNIGQDCTAGSRLFVQDTIYDKFIKVSGCALTDRVGCLLNTET